MSKIVVFGISLVMASTSSAQVARPSDLAASKAIIGNWVSSEMPPPDKLDEICDTDYFDRFLPAGKYEPLYGKGTWSIHKGVLTMSVVRSNYSTGGEGPFKRLAKPQIRKLTIESLRDGIAKVRTKGKSAWLIKCPNP